MTKEQVEQGKEILDKLTVAEKLFKNLVSSNNDDVTISASFVRKFKNELTEWTNEQIKKLQKELEEL
jgi:hypothetical protein